MPISEVIGYFDPGSPRSKTHDKIVGYKFRDQEHKILQYAYDICLCADNAHLSILTHKYSSTTCQEKILIANLEM